MTAANDNMHVMFKDKHCVVFLNSAVLMFDRILEAKEFINDYYAR